MRPTSCRSTCLVLATVVVLAVADPTSYVLLPASRTSDPAAGLSWSQFYGYNTSAYLAIVTNPVGNFRVLYPHASPTNNSCIGYMNTSVAARANGCLYATNGGPFVMGQPAGLPTCMGHIVADGVVVQTDNSGFPSFGLTQDGNFCLGMLNASQVTTMAFEQLLTGFGWLLFNGTVQSSIDPEVAPRTALGVDAKGRLMIFQADGIETVFVGLTLNQLAEWMLLLGAVYAINLDGGGSSVTVVNGTIVDAPRCTDLPTVVCERSVTTAVCVMP